jgi:hypothetical protein
MWSVLAERCRGLMGVDSLRLARMVPWCDPGDSVALVTLSLWFLWQGPLSSVQCGGRRGPCTL